MIRVRLQAIERPGVVELPSRLLPDGWMQASPGAVSFGQTKVTAAITARPGDGRPAPVGVGRDLLAALGLPSGSKLWAGWDSAGNRLRLGPVVAVFAWRSNSPHSYHFFGPVTDMIRSFVRLARRRGAAAYAFSARDVNWAAGTVAGFVPSGRGWRRVTMPLPDVVYDRLQTRRLDRVKSIRQCKQQLQAIPELHYFNPCFLDKWEVYQALVKDPRARRYLPRTDRLISAAQVGRWLRSFSTVYVKPTRGSLGLGITKISRTAGGFRYQRIREKGSQIGVVDSVPKLERRLKVVLPHRAIIQQGLHLARLSGRPYDIRVIAQKTPRGRWVSTSMIARVSAPGSAVSNVAEGGAMIPVWKAVRGSLHINCRHTIARIRRGARVIARALEAQLGREFGEFGVDLALDTRGRLWLIEVNAKPNRENDNLPGVPPSMRRIVRYAIHKAGF